jgi:pyruvate dehydrogenase E1 component alpha subunit
MTRGKETQVSVAQLYREMLGRMMLIRAFEERVIELSHRKQLEGLVHVGIGQEGIAVAVATALGEGDYVYGTHRSHGHFLARGADPSALMAELGGRRDGLCGGYGGSMHLVDPERGLMTATGIVGGSIPLALGTALAVRDEGRVVVVYFGDGASNTGSFHECLNMASLWSLPLIMVCENNGYAEFTPISAHTNVSHVSTHGEPYGIAATIIDGNDTLAVLDAARAAVARARAGDGPTIVECQTYRLRGHYIGDPQAYRQADEIAEWREKDPVRAFTRFLSERHGLTEAESAAMRNAAAERVDAAARFMADSPWPATSAVTNFVYA